MAAVTAVAAATAAMVAMAAAVTVAAGETVDPDNVVTSPEHESLAVKRLLKELGRGRLRSGQQMASYFVEELWLIHNGSSLQLTASRVNLPPAFVLGEWTTT